MAVDASKLLKRRKGLGAPPIEGAPGMEDLRPRQFEPESAPTMPALVRPEVQESTTAEEVHRAKEATVAGEPAPPGAEPAPEAKTEVVPMRGAMAPTGQGGGEDPSTPALRQRVPPSPAEPRVPFTTRVTLTTKERLEDACYHLRRKHQDFINEAILAHLERHGF